MRKQGLSFIQKLIRYLGTRNVRLQSRGLPKGMGQWRQGTIKKVGGARGWTDTMSVPRASQVMGGGRIFTPSGGGKSKFITKGSTYGHTRGTKIAGTGVGGGALITAAAYTQEAKAPSGPATAGQKQFSAVRPSFVSSNTKTRSLSGPVVKQLRKTSKEFMTRSITQGGKVISAKPYKSISGSSLGPYSKDIAKIYKSGYHKFKAGSAGAKSFQAAHKAAGGKQFRWKGTGKLYSGA